MVKCWTGQMESVEYWIPGQKIYFLKRKQPECLAQVPPNFFQDKFVTWQLFTKILQVQSPKTAFKFKNMASNMVRKKSSENFAWYLFLDNLMRWTVPFSIWMNKKITL